MKRDMDLFRLLLLAIEDCAEPPLEQLPEFDGYDRGLVVEHVRLAIDGGYITAIDASSWEQRNYLQLEMKWRGHEFLDSIRDPEIWASTKAGAAKVGAFSISFLAELAVGYAKAKAQSLGLPMM